MRARCSALAATFFVRRRLARRRRRPQAGLVGVAVPWFRLSALKEGRWRETILRFVLGGLATAATGLIADIWGPVKGGLFLALPAIFCASVTLIEKHERERKEKKGMKGAGAAGAPLRSTPRAGPLAAWRSPRSAESSGFAR